MNHLAQHQDVWQLATDQDKGDLLVSLASLPSRQTVSAAIEDAAYFSALEGTTRYGLVQAAKAVFKNVLGHPFYPMPQELRKLHDDAMAPHQKMRDRIAHQRRLRLTEQEKKRREKKAA